MIGQGRLRETATRVATVAVAGAVAGGLYVTVSDRSVTSELAQGAVTGLLMATLLGSFEALLNDTAVGERIRSIPFGLLLAVRTAVYLVVIIAGLILSDVVFDAETVAVVMRDDTFGQDIAFALSIAVTVNFFIMLRDLLGRRVLANFMFGRYHRPRPESRRFMVIDLVGSTRAAERLGDVRFLELLDWFFSDLASAVLDSRGEIYKYVGDAAIVSWGEHGLRADANGLSCYLDFRRRLASRRQRYLERFGELPKFRAAFHAGPIVAGEIGDIKREIVYLGDTLNATFRIEEECKQRKLAALASSASIEGLDVPPELRLRPVGTVTLRGKSAPVSLLAIETEMPELKASEPGSVPAEAP